MARGTRTADEESISGYFRSVYDQNPKLLKQRSNKPVLDQWLADRPGYEDVPERVKANLANLKSNLRKKRRIQRGKRAELADNGIQAVGKRPSIKGLELLEEQIDDCLTVAKHLDRQGLHEIISLLRRARNGIVWMIGEK